MNTRYLAILVTLALLGFSAPAAAHPCDRDPVEDHKHCIAETPQTTFSVDMSIGDQNSGDGLVPCTGTATGRNLGPDFYGVADPCKITLDNGNKIFGIDDPVEVCLLGASVRISKKRTRVMIFMYDCDNAENVFRTLELPAMVEDIKGGGFIVRLVKSEESHELKKNHEPDKERPLEEEIFVGDIVYTDPDLVEL